MIKNIQDYPEEEKKEKKRIYYREWFKKYNKTDKRKAWRKEYENSEKRKKYKREWELKNKDKKKKYKREWELKNKDKKNKSRLKQIYISKQEALIILRFLPDNEAHIDTDIINLKNKIKTKLIGMEKL
jgi:hypothetical protein